MRAPGLRLQILVALAGIILVAYVPLFFAIAEVTRATTRSYREDTARGLGRAIAAHVGDVERRDPQELAATLEADVGEGGAQAVVVYGEGGKKVASAGVNADSIHPPSRPYGESVTRPSAHALDVTMPTDHGAVVVRVSTEDDSPRGGQLVQLIALYMGVFALALLFIAYLVLTRTIVRPIEQLARAADKVASGARVLEVPRGGAREIAELGTSVREMATRLMAEEDKMRVKVGELTSTRAQLEGSERMASVGKLAAGVAHEIGNPIAAIMGMHDLLDDGELPNETREDFLRRMRKETERINVVVRDLLDYARPETGPASTAIASVAEVANDALALVKPQKGWKNIETKVEIPADLRVQLSSQRLTQVFLNVLLNAAAVDPKHVTVRARAAGDAKVRIEIEDDGPGISRDLRDRIFDPFVTTKEVGAGTGLGLSVCRGIVEAAKGRIFVDASYDKGARFVVELPTAVATSSAP